MNKTLRGLIITAAAALVINAAAAAKEFNPDLHYDCVVNSRPSHDWKGNMLEPKHFEFFVDTEKRKIKVRGALGIAFLNGDSFTNGREITIDTYHGQRQEVTISNTEIVFGITDVTAEFARSAHTFLNIFERNNATFIYRGADAEWIQAYCGETLSAARERWLNGLHAGVHGGPAW